ncbi:RNA polymerase sigma factor [Devosia sp. A449]
MDLTTLGAAGTPAADSEQALVAQARQGSESAIRRLIKANNQRLFRVARSVMRNDGEAEDVVQATYVKAFTHLDTFRGESQFSTWLTRIALNDALGRVRKRRVTTDLTALDAAVESDSGLGSLFPLSLVPLSADSEADRTEMRKLLEHAIDQLPEAFRLVFILRDVEGLSIAEAASQLGIKPETVKTRLHRARQLLRTTIEQQIAGSFADVFPFDGARCDSMADKVIAALASAS